MYSRSRFETMAFQLELQGKFTSFSALNFLKAFDNGNLSDNDIDRFFAMYKMSSELIKEDIKRAKEIEKKSKRG